MRVFQPAEESQKSSMLRRQALCALSQGCNVPAALGLLRRLQGQPHAARQVRPQPRQQLGAQCLSWQNAI